MKRVVAVEWLRDKGTVEIQYCPLTATSRIQFILFLVTISALPRSPSNVRVSDVQPTSVRLSWSYDGDVASEVQYYVIQYKPKAATWDYKEISGAITNFYDIRGLR